MAPSKVELTTQLVSKLPVTNITVDEALKDWWMGAVDNTGLRLSDEGFFVLTTVLNLDSYYFTISPEMVTSGFLLKVARYFDCPFYLVPAKKTGIIGIRVFGSKEATLITLYGDLGKYLASNK